MANYTQPDYVYARPRYFDGEFLIDQDFADEQIYHIDRAWRHNRLLHVAGIAEGLGVSVPDATNQPFVVAVAPGTAIDSLGRTVVLPDDASRENTDDTQASRTLDVSTYTGKNGYLVLVYPVSQVAGQGMATALVFDQQTKGTAGTETHFSEWGQLQFVQDEAQLPAGAVVLAHLAVGTSVDIDLTPRQYSGLGLPTPTDNAPLTLRTIVNSNSANIAQLAGNLSVNGYVGIGTTTPGYPLEVAGDILMTGPDFGLFNPSRAGGAGGAYRRALVHDASDTLAINFSNDYTGGTRVDGSLKVSVNLTVSGTVGIGTTSAPTQKLQVDSGNVLVRGASNFAASGNTATMYFGDTNHFIQSTYGTGVTIGTNGVSNGIVLQQSTGNVGLSTASAPTQKLQVDSGNVLVRGANNYGASGNTAAVYVGDTNHILQSTYGTGTKLAIPASENLLLGSSGKELTVSGGGSVTVTSNLTMNGTDFQIFNTGRAGTATGTTRRALVHDGSDTLAINYSKDYTGGTRLDGSLRITENLTVGGTVGIGTAAAPTQKLQVDSGNVLVRGANNFAASGNTATVYFGDTNHFIQSTYGTGVTIGTNGVSNGIVLLQTSGNVGIGTASPSYRLQVGTSTTDFFNVNTSLSGMGQLEMLGWGSGWNFQVKTANKNLYINRDAPSTSNVYIGCSGKELTVSGSNGYVGINLGTGTPDQQLTVGGSIKETGSDFEIFNTSRAGGAGGTRRRAMVHDNNDVLTINYAGDYTGGTQVSGNLSVGGNLYFYWTGSGGKGVGWRQIVNGDGNDSGAGTTFKGTSYPSDARLKTEIEPIRDAVAKVLKIRGVGFRWNESGLQFLTRHIENIFSAGPGATAEEHQKVWAAERTRQYEELANLNFGVLAQEVETALPAAVATGDADYKTVNYHALIPLLIEAVRELWQEVQSLRTQPQSG